MRTRIPLQLNRSLAVALGLALAIAVGALTSCAKHATPHPNQLNAFDGQVYDALTTAQATLDEAKAQYKAGKFAALPNAREIINAAGASYEQTRTTWMLWRDVNLGVKQGDAAAMQMTLQNDMNQLAASIAKVVTLVQQGGK